MEKRSEGDPRSTSNTQRLGDGKIQQGRLRWGQPLRWRGSGKGWWPGSQWVEVFQEW